MADFNKIQLPHSCILKVPLHSYSKDFTFIVNGEEFQTSRIISDFLSPNICDAHLIDPTLNKFEINTQSSGHFSYILNLLSFDQVDIPENEIPFILEVINILENESITLFSQGQHAKLSIDNILSLIENHEKYNKFFAKSLSEEINFASSNFNELFQTKKEEFSKLSISTINDIISNPNLQLETEDQLLTFINDLYYKDSNYFCLYEKVLFCNVSSESIQKFIEIFDINDLTGEMWNKLSQRLIQKVQNDEFKIELKRYKNKIVKESQKKFPLKNTNEFNGIIKYLKSNNIGNEINITASSCYNDGDDRLQAKNVVLFDSDDGFSSKDIPESWLKIEFKNHLIIPTDYVIKTSGAYTDEWRPKSWVIEGSNDNSKWEILSEEKNCNYLNGNLIVHAFKIQKVADKGFKYIRMKQTGTNVNNDNVFDIGSIEFYGSLI